MVRSPTFVSLFSGIGGLDLAVESLGFECVGQVEWDESCTRVLERWWPTVPRWGDVQEFTAAAYAASKRRPREVEPCSDVEYHGLQPSHMGPRVDLIVGGFPCQPASHAGRRKGTEDGRWLWPEFARVAGELGPRFVLVENVPGLLTVNGGRAFSEVVGTLADLGYDATWISLRASDVGACHRRERIFLLATDTEPEQRPRDSVRAGGLPAASSAIANARDGESEEFVWGAYGSAIERWERILMRYAPRPVDAKGRLAPPFVEWMQGFPEGWTDQMSRTQALKALGNAVVPRQGAAALSILLGLWGCDE